MTARDMSTRQRVAVLMALTAASWTMVVAAADALARIAG